MKTDHLPNLRSVHMHIIIYASLRKRLTVQKQNVIRDREVELANKTLFDLSRLVNQPSSLLYCIPTSEPGSSEKCTNYDVREYPIYSHASRLIKGAKGGIWDLVIEDRQQQHENQNTKYNDSSEEDDEDEDDGYDDFATGRRGLKRKAKGGKANRKGDRGKHGPSARKAARRQRAPSSSPLTEIEDDDEDEEVVNKDAWPLLTWIIDLWTRAKPDAAGKS